MNEPSAIAIVFFVILFCIGVAVTLAGVFVVFVKVIAPLFQRDE